MFFEIAIHFLEVVKTSERGEIKMKNNLTRSCLYLRTLSVVCDNLPINKNFKLLDNIVIYNENGVLINTDLGYFESNIDNETIKGEINFLRTDNQKQKAIANKENFVVKSEPKDYKFEVNNTLYIYYKNINYKVTSIEKDNVFLNVNYTIFDKYKESLPIGNLTKKSDSIMYNDIYNNIEKLEKEKYSKDFEKLTNIMNDIKKAMKKYKKIQEEEKQYPIEKLINATRNDEQLNREIYINNLKLLESEK